MSKYNSVKAERVSDLREMESNTEIKGAVVMLVHLVDCIQKAGF